MPLKEDKIMDRLQAINVEIFQCLSYIADDSSYMERALRALKRLTKQKMEGQAAGAQTKTEQGILNDIPAVAEQMKAAREKRVDGVSLDEFLNEI